MRHLLVANDEVRASLRARLVAGHDSILKGVQSFHSLLQRGEVSPINNHEYLREVLVTKTLSTLSYALAVVDAYTPNSFNQTQKRKGWEGLKEILTMDVRSTDSIYISSIINKNTIALEVASTLNETDSSLTIINVGCFIPDTWYPAIRRVDLDLTRFLKQDVQTFAGSIEQFARWCVVKVKPTSYYNYNREAPAWRPDFMEGTNE